MRRRASLVADALAAAALAIAERTRKSGIAFTYLSLIRWRAAEQDPSLAVLLELDGQRFTFEPSGYSVKFEARRVPATPDRPHGISYSLTLHSPQGTRLVGFDNAHGVRSSRGPGGKRTELDHRHRLGATRPYRYVDAGQLLADFWRDVDTMLSELGVER